MAEFSDAQYETLVGMLADNRVAITDLANTLKLAEQEWHKKLDLILNGLKLQGASLTAIEEDLSQIQKDMREVKETVALHTQAFEGITQLTKTNFELLESLQRHVHGESQSIRHDQHEQAQ